MKKKPTMNHFAYTKADLVLWVEQLRRALDYVLVTRKVNCASPTCKSGKYDDYCAYHRAKQALR